jgi:hypothetical protein
MNHICLTVYLFLNWSVPIMARRILLSHCVLVVLLATAHAVRCAPEERNHDWTVLMAVQPGEKLLIKFKDGKKLKGEFRSVSENTLALSHDGETASFDKLDIQEIRLGHGRSFKKPILIGALVGAGAGAGLGAAASASDNGDWFDFKPSQTIPVGAAVGAIFGTATGAVIGLVRGQGELIYRAP